MNRCLLLFTFFLLISPSHAAETFRLLLDKGYSESLVDYLESNGVAVVRTQPFAEIEKSEGVAERLGAFAQLQRSEILQARIDFWNDSNMAEPSDKQSNRYDKLRDAKIRHRLALQALASCSPDLVAAGPLPGSL